MNSLMLFAGLAVLTAALFSYRHPLSRRLGLAGIAATTFAAGYLATGNWIVGAVCMLGWLFLPWLEILLRVRHLRLPLRKELRQTAPPARDQLPELNGLSDEIEAAGFEHAADLGWEMEGYRQFFRLFANPETRTEASITFVEQNQLGFHFVSVTSRAASGAVFTTWNCPVSSSLKMPPSVRLHRVVGDATFDALCREHTAALARDGAGGLLPVDPDGIRPSVERDMEAQMQHNMREGLLRAADDGHGRYSWRGMLFLWWQVVRDIFRFT